MYFADYIQKLHNCIEPTAKRGDFTERILKMIVRNESLIDYSPSSYNGFYDGKTEVIGEEKVKVIIDDKIHNCAKRIVGYLDISDDKTKSLPNFKEYLKNLQFNTATKNDLCDSFRCELPNINVDNYIDELSELLIKVIKEAAKDDALSNRSMSSSAHIDTNTPITGNQLANKIKAKHAEKIEDIIEKLQELCRGMLYGYEFDYQKDVFQKMYYQYKELNAKLAGYAILYPFIESLSKIPQSLLKERDFFILDEENLLKNYQDYMDLLMNIRKEVNGLEEV